jgi:hypothetical protein
VGLWSAVVGAALAAGCAGSPRPKPADTEDTGAKGDTEYYEISPDRCTPSAARFMQEHWNIRPGDRARVVFRTEGDESSLPRGIIVGETTVELKLLEKVGDFPEGSVLVGPGSFGGGDSGSGRRFHVRVVGGHLPGMQMLFPICMMLTQGGQWGTPVEEEGGYSVVKPEASVEAVTTFDEGTRPTQ